MSEENKSMELAVANKQNSTSLTVNDLARMSKMFYDSGLFTDTKSMAAVAVKIQCGQELGIPPFQAISGVHIIKGKPSIGAGLMASMLDSHPMYDFEVKTQDEKKCIIDFFKSGKKKGTSTFTIEMARQAGLLSNPTWKAYPQNMLYARAMSNGVRMYTPGLFAGPVYVPEELEAIEQEPEVQSNYEDVSEPHHEENKVVDALAEVDAVTSRKELDEVWKKYDDLQSDDDFTKAVKKKAEKYPKEESKTTK